MNSEAGELEEIGWPLLSPATLLSVFRTLAEITVECYAYIC